MKSTLSALIAHCGGDDATSDVRRMACRRIAALEAELISHEDRIASVRRRGKEPPASLLQTYIMLTNQQLRLSKEIGWDRSKKNVKDIDLASYIRGKARVRPVPEVMDHE
ncbi:hypothetical protein AB8A20_20860 [Tardiphaga sp. 604_B6_N1_1]|uniref:hypothetical protein n=1 Tax=Tardiphaga sp. 604_B6_N1_1 TaxID=3240779 RepID=UPI003F265250